MSCRINMCISSRWLARRNPVVWPKRHGKRPPGRLFPFARTERALVCASAFTASQALVHRLLPLRALELTSWNSTGSARSRAAVCAARISVGIGQQTGRERPRCRLALAAPAIFQGSLTSCLPALFRRGVPRQFPRAHALGIAMRGGNPVPAEVCWSSFSERRSLCQ